MFGISLKKLSKSFKYAFSGIKTIFEEEHAFKIMFFIAILVIVAMFYFHLPLLQKILLFALITLVLVLELINSVIEKVLDFVCPKANGRVRVIKDVMAGIVLMASVGAGIIGVLVFYPYILGY